MNAKKINYHLYGHFSNYEYRLFNSYIYAWESDFFAVSKTGYSVEVEIKISKSDFTADFKKETFQRENKHEILTCDSKVNKPNKFYFACPEGLIKPEELNINYGLIWINERNSQLIRDAKFLHKNKILENKHYLRKLLDKFYYRNMELRQKLDVCDWDIKHGQKRLEYNF
jgi:hypothetical protein